MATTPEYQRKYYLANKDRKRDAARERYARNPEKYRAKSLRTYHRRPDAAARSTANSKEWYAKNPAKILFNAAKTRAKKRGIPFDLTPDDIVIPSVCPILGVPIAASKGGPGTGSPSVDRIDPSKGYVRGNVWVISFKANRMKDNADLNELLTFARGVLRIFGQKA